jgi:nucleoside-diphosphate-sugar epimerase
MTKSLAEQAVDFFRAHHGVNSVCLRFGWLAPLRLYADVKMLYRTLSFCFHPQDAAAAVLAAMDSTQQGNYLIAAPMPWSESDGEALWRDPRALLAARFGHELEYLERRGCPIAPIACWLDSSRAQRELGYRPRYDFRWFVRQHEAGAFAGSAQDEAVRP